MAGLTDDPSAIVSKGEGCSRGSYSISEADMQAIKNVLDEIDGNNPYVTYNEQAVRRTLAGNSKATVGCMVWYINDKIAQNAKLAEYGIFAHTDHGNVRFDRNAPSKIEAEEPK